MAEPAAAAVKMRHNLVSFHQQFSFFLSLQKLFSAFSYTFFTFILERFFSIINFFCGAACLHSIWWNFVHVNCFFDAFAPVCVAFSVYIASSPNLLSLLRLFFVSTHLHGALTIYWRDEYILTVKKRVWKELCSRIQQRYLCWCLSICLPFLRFLRSAHHSRHEDVLLHVCKL